MKTIFLSTLASLLIFTLTGCKSVDGPIVIPDFSQCDCSFSTDIVCGEDGRNYLNECLANCVGTKVDREGNCPEEWFVEADTLTWPIEWVCIPIQGPGDPVAIRTLKDGSVLYQNPDSSFFRGNQNLCRCLPSMALISAEKGERPINELNIGEKIWTFNLAGTKELQAILAVQKIPVESDHVLVHLHLSDGRAIAASPMHPDADGRLLVALEIGDELDGAMIVKKELLPFTERATYDLLPAGETGIYIVNGVKMGSTMFKNHKSQLP